MLLQSNTTWDETPQAEIQATSPAPNNAKDAAILQSHGPGNYSATVIGKNGGTGVGLVEVVRLP